MQGTLKSAVAFSGTGLHSGLRVRMTLHPAPADFGVVFRRTDCPGGDVLIPASWRNLDASRLCTRISDGQGHSVSTIEHVLAALVGCGVHNALIEINGPEVPVLDGSAAPLVAGILQAGLRHQDAPLFAIRLLSPVEVTQGDGLARLEPCASLEIDFGIEFDDSVIGRQRKWLDMANGAFVHELSDSRTFCRLRDVESMRENGLALGGNFDNAVVVDGPRVLSPGGLRYKDEPVRHKMLDALGDLALAGAPLLARYVGRRAGHALTAALLQALFARPETWDLVELSPEQLRRLPGAGLLADELRASA